MLVSNLIKELEKLPQDTVIVCGDESGSWDNIIEVKGTVTPVIVFGGGSSFSDE